MQGARRDRIKGALLAGLAAVLLAACGQEEGGGGGIGVALKTLSRETSVGARLVRRRCATCHDLERGIRKVGPSLKGIYGRAPSIRGVPFERWDERALDQWIRNPTAVKPNTAMAIPGIASAEDRAAIIDYLKRL